jgi:predicted Zn-dependent protease
MIFVAAAMISLAACAVNPVTGEREFMTISPAEDLALGAQNYAPMVQSQGGEYDVDPALTAYVQSVGKRLADVSDVALPYEFTVLNSSVPNAWALPGGKIAINRGLLTEMGSEAELAAVLGHHHGEQCIARDVEGHAEEGVRTALVELAAEFALGHVELEQAVARR